MLEQQKLIKCHKETDFIDSFCSGKDPLEPLGVLDKEKGKCKSLKESTTHALEKNEKILLSTKREGEKESKWEVEGRRDEMRCDGMRLEMGRLREKNRVK